MSKHLVFLKLGGSLITVKDQPRTPRLEVLQRLAGEISEALAQDSRLQILLGHGSGSFGHTAASRYRTREGVKTAEDWEGFADVRQQAAELNRLVMDALIRPHLPVVVFSPSAAVVTRQGKVAIWNLDPLQAALNQGLLPVVYGDVAYDQELGGTILSTEDLFCHLAYSLKPTKLLFAGMEPGVWADYPHNRKLIEEISPSSFPSVKPGLQGSSATDVTGGMLGKVQKVIALVNALPDVQGMIFSGEVPDNVRRALLGEQLGTSLHAG